MIEGLSVIICCFNTGFRIKSVLEYIARQELEPHQRLEVVLVDNNCKDDTLEIARRTWLEIKCGHDFRIVSEPLQGLSYARYRGCKEAQFPIVIFCDDDNWLDATYSANVFNFFENHAKAGIVGGLPTAVSETVLPDWFAGRQELFACGKLYPHTGKLKAGEYVFGAGMAARRSVLLCLMDPEFPMLCKDRTGKELTSGGDFEICLRAAIAGYEIWYDESLQLKHFMPQQRLTRDYCDKLLAKLPEHTFYLRKYDTFFVISKRNWISRQLSLAYNFIKYFIAVVTSNQHQKQWARDHLYFLTGLTWFATESTAVVWAFAKANRSK